MELPTWVMSPYSSLKSIVPSKREIEDRTLGTRRGRLALVGAVYVGLISIYLSGAFPYPALGEEGWISFYEMSSTERGALAWGMIAGVVSYPVAKRVIALVYSPDENILRVIDPQGEIEETWILGDEKLADMDVIGGELATRRTIKGKVWLCIGYEPEENVAYPTWEGTMDARRAQTMKDLLNQTITETQERARDADRLEREQPEIVRKSVRKEMREWIEKMDEVDPIVSGDGYKEARADVLGEEFESDSTEREAETRRQNDEKERTNGDTEEVVGIDEAMPDGGDE